MRTDPTSIKLAKVRRYIRDAIKWHHMDNGMPHFYTSNDYRRAKAVCQKDVMIGNYPYYIKSEKAIKELAEKIYDVVIEDDISKEPKKKC